MRALFPCSASLLLIYLISFGGSWIAAADPPADPELDVLRRLDLDKNGYVTPPEIPPAMKSFVAGIVRRSGLTEGKPISLDGLLRSRRELKVAPDESELKSGVVESSKSRAAAEGPRKPSPALFAENLLKLYDKNDSGLLEEGEWSRLHESWKERDAEADGTLTLEELTAAFTAIAAEAEKENGRDGSRPISPAVAAPADAQPPVNSGPRVPAKPNRVGRSRLPAWLAALDANGDDQVQMAEYSKEWPAAKIAEFMRYDRDNDGFITPAEAAAARQGR
jgi:Ca2+-binding EF-hand superfamily protein